jgi:uncharacterized protein YjbJ (UPF0337 family)
MNKDQVEGKAKDVAGRVERQVGEWTGNTDAQVNGTLKQAEGKVQNAWGDAKDATKKASDTETAEIEANREEREEEIRRRKAS